MYLSRLREEKPNHHGLLVRLLDGVAGDGGVAVVFGGAPVQGHVSSPHLFDGHGLGRPGQV